ncbi:AMP-dependent synthetase/ligase [Acetivibrio cellulolyticus]|uniref:AMP-dependent synthetase/ligase n=1 Tax=Acetivibrio cellulolyticus TaxID=35830 RepID=UPI0001E2FB72|nr:AMP-binding protein [Acetivibrio cellulolyticus]
MKKCVDIFSEDGRLIVRGRGCYETRKVNDLKELIQKSAQNYGDAPAFKFKDKNGKIVSRSYIDFERDINNLGTALISIGLKGKRIAIIGENRYEWGVAYYSIVNGTGIAVPMDKYLPPVEIENLIERGKVEAIFYSPTYHEIMCGISKNNTRINHFICMEDISQEDDKFLSLPHLIKMGEQHISNKDMSFIESRIDREAMSILLFTSGTTSLAKGVMLSHTNIAANVTSITGAIKVYPGDVYLSLLPLHHTFENTIGLAFMVHSGICVAFSDGIKYVAQNLQEYGVSVLVAVPAILEAMYRKLQSGIEKSGKAKTLNLLIKVSEILRSMGIDLRRKFFKSVFNKLGPRLRLVISGAAPLDPEVIKGFDKLGLKLLQGYGLTETSPVVSTNNDFVNKPGTIGPPLCDIEVAIDNPDENGMGEIIVRGKNVMLGYYEDIDTTREVLDEKGWFRTGDLGSIDGDGIIKISGRAKSMIVFTNGKKAFPEEYEVLLNDHPYVKDSFAWGNRTPDGDIQACAELVVDMDAIRSDKKNTPSDEELASMFGEAIKSINNMLPKYKIIRYFVLTNEDLVKTTTLKIKRPVELEKINSALGKAGIDMRKANGKFIEKLNSAK